MLDSDSDRRRGKTPRVARHRPLRRATTEAFAVARADTDTHLHLRERLVGIALATVAVDLVCAVLIYVFERDTPRTEITTLGDALFWTSAQLLTVGSPFPNPLTSGGRIVHILLAIYGITVVGALAGSFGAFFHRRGRERDAAAVSNPTEGPAA